MSVGSDFFERYERWFRLLFWVVLASILLLAARLFAPILEWVLRVLSPFLIALIVAYIVHPIVTFFQKRLKVGRVGGILILVALLLLLLGGVLFWLAPILYKQAISLIEGIRQSVDLEKNQWLIQHLDPETRQLIMERAELTLDELQKIISEALAQFGGLLRPMASGGAEAIKTVAGGIWASLYTVGGFFAMIGIVIAISFYYLLDMEAIPSVIRRLLPTRHHEHIWTIMVRSEQAVGGFLRGQLMVCVIVGVLFSILLFILGMKQYAILLGFTAGLINFIPYLGPAAGALMAFSWILFSDAIPTWSEKGIKVLILVIGFSSIQAIEGFVLQPNVVGRSASLPPLLVFLALVVGAQGGIGGMILAVPLACVVRVLWNDLFWRNRVDFKQYEAMESLGDVEAGELRPDIKSPEQSPHEEQ